MSYKDIKFPENSIFLVTGGAGFIGSNLCEAILNMGYKVRCLDNLSTGFQRNIDLFKENKNFEFIHGDIRDFETCIKATEKVDYVLHQAAWGSVPRSIIYPLLYEEINIKGSLNMLEAARQNNVKKFVYASSSSVYGDHPVLPKVEGVEGELLSPYAITKRTNEEYGKIYKKLYNLDTYGLRYFNVFGRKQNPNGDYAAVIPRFINQLLRNIQPIIFGDGTQTRDFTYIENVIDANLKACSSSSDSSGLVYNIASGGRVSVNDIFEQISTKLKKDVNPIYSKARVGDIDHSNAKISLAIKNLNYEPNYSFEKGIDETLDWFISNDSYF